MCKEIHVKCQQGICPLCGGELEYQSSTPDSAFWQCTKCHANGEEGYHFVPGADGAEERVFDGCHYEVVDGKGNLVNIIPTDKEPDASGQPDSDSEENRLVTIAYEKIGVCPICGRDDIDVVRNDNGYGDYHYSSTCNDCNATWEEPLEVIEVHTGYECVEDGEGNPVDVVIQNAPELSVRDIAPLVPMCHACDSDMCIFNPEGICRYPLVFGEEPKVNFFGCMGMYAESLGSAKSNGIDEPPVRSCTEGDYGASSPWNAPGMRASDFIR